MPITYLNRMYKGFTVSLHHDGRGWQATAIHTVGEQLMVDRVLVRRAERDEDAWRAITMAIDEDRGKEL